ncbi:methylated-DNA--[protein]-cysteine S-methyltransferase [Flocculibacter collagenilyticus]|uniref:methylated-DNA--[protein]-cysteine S-methyltransferase n=1 Tax=Flocculibacter collagenilyticus TaxID=2744479 RepID=UPI0018F63FE2|nr:methylated-DNA--[protein]-cysteine S-methyltransferase [Flocculibacter collagenilyticus]
MNFISLHTPIGELTIIASNQGVTEVTFDFEASKVTDNFVNNPTSQRHLQQAKQELEEYFTGKRKHFTFTLAAKGTEFQNKVWQQLSDIPYGIVQSYSDIALKLNNPKGVRAVGMANGKNPIAIAVPCHRVIGKNGTLTGYAGGLNRKAWLLQHEQKHR